ncbi:uncharacterized protein VTP21DRAFT_6676 [Calcarisporiella thermophila]|uniref:uncharacterized protein n=1 Tax=Calcarisporiella thermophila TaxID=911321 RepID=UPI003742AEFE
MSDRDTPPPQHKPRKQPNILVTGTPGTGKTTTCEMIAEQTGLEHINIGQLVKERGLHEGYDQEFDTYILDEDKLCDELEEELAPGGKIIDFHSSEFFPERWFDLVLVLRTDNTTLYDRLKARGYSQRKITENIECEIMQVVLEEARESYAEEIVVELPSNTVEEMESNVSRVLEWLRMWRERHQ